MQAQRHDTFFPSPAHKHIYVHGDSEGDASQLDVMRIVRSISKRKGSILLLGMVIALLVGVIVYSMTPIYRATATLLIDPNKPKIVSIEDIYGGALQQHDYFVTQLEILKSRDLALKAIGSLRLWDVPEFDPRIKERKPWDALLETLGVGVKEEAREWSQDALAQEVYGKFRSRMLIAPVRSSQLVQISFDSASPELAAKVANAFANTYIDSDLAARLEMNRKASQWLQDQVGALKEKLVQSERALQAYRESKGIVDTKAQSGAEIQFGDTTARLLDARMRRAEAETVYRQIKDAKTLEELSTIPSVLRDAAVAKAKSDLADADRRFSEVSQRYGFEHPDYISAKAKVDSARSILKRQVDIAVASLTREFDAARSIEGALSATLAAAKSSVQNINRNEFQLGVLEREVDSNRQFYETFMNRLKETSISSDLQTANARIAESAFVSGSPIKPNKSQIIAVAFVLGMMLGMLIAVLLDMLDQSIKSTDEVESRLHAPFLAALPLLEKREAAPIKALRIMLDKPESSFSEAIRTTTSGVLLSAIDLPNRVLLVTSSFPGEGKSTLSVNLALSHAKTKRTLLIDADMRRPSIGKNLMLPPGAKGLANLVAGTAKLEECVHSIDGSSLFIMPVGALPPNPLELLLSNRFKGILEHLATQFEIIVIDSPPVDLVSDALVIAAHATGVIYAVKAMDTPYKVARKGIDRILRANGDLVGVVLTHFDQKKAYKYHGEFSGFGKYREGYGHAYARKAEPVGAKA